MCKFKSGIILKNRIVLAPIYNESHSNLLRQLNIEDTHINASKMFVRAELIPYANDKKYPVSEWKFVVDQDIVPDWFTEDRVKYEEEFRGTVRDWMADHYEMICGEMCLKVEKSENQTVYMTERFLFTSKFGKDNNYATSEVREKLRKCEFAQRLQETYRDRLVPVKTDLLSYDGFDDYGTIEEDILALRTFDQNRKWRKNITNADSWEHLATPHSTPSGYGSGNVGCVNSSGGVGYSWDGGVVGVRGVFILKSLIFESKNVEE